MKQLIFRQFLRAGVFCSLLPTLVAAAPVRGLLRISQVGRDKESVRAYWNLENRILPVARKKFDVRQETIVTFTGEDKTNRNDPTVVSLIEFDGLQAKPAVLTTQPFGTLKLKNSDRYSHTPFVFAVPESDAKADPIIVVPPEPIAPGQTRTVKLPPAGIYWIRDHEFPHVEGCLLVLTTPYFVRADEQGSFKLDLPPGKYAMRLFQNGKWQSTLPIQVDAKGVDLTAQLGAADAPPPPPPLKQFGAH